MNTFKLIAILLCTFLLIPLEGYSQTIEIYTDLKGNEHAAINSEGMVRYKVEERSKSSTFLSYINTHRMVNIRSLKKMKAVMIFMFTERHGIQRDKKKEDVTGKYPDIL